MKIKKFLSFLFLFIFATGCFHSAEKKLLEKVKTQTIDGYNKCVGVNGNVKYDIFEPTDNKGNENLRIIDIKLSRSDRDIKEIHFQIHANIETQFVSETPSYFAIDGESQSLFAGAFAMIGFCEINLDSLF